MGKPGDVARDDVVVLAAVAGHAGALGDGEQQLVGDAGVRLRMVDRHEAVVAPPQVNLRPVECGAVRRLSAAR